MKIISLHGMVIRDDLTALGLCSPGDVLVDLPDRRGRTPLQLACELGKLSVAHRLVALGAKVDVADGEGTTPLMCAAAEGHGDIAELVLDAGADPYRYDNLGNTALHLAAWRGRWEVVRLFLVRTPGVSGRVNRDGMIPAVLAAIEGHVLCLAQFVGHSGVSGVSDALQQASAGNRIEVISYLLESGTDVNSRDHGRRTALHWAVQQGHLEAVETLLRAGADPNVVADDSNEVDGTLPLALAAAGGQVGIVIRLLESGAKPDLPQSDGATALHLAAGFNKIEVVKVLLSVGASPAVKDRDGHRPVDYARRRRRRRIVRLLEDAAANDDPPG